MNSLTKALLGGLSAAAVSAIVPAHAGVIVTFTYTYPNTDVVMVTATNDTPYTLTGVTLAGVNFGPLGAYASNGPLSIGDVDETGPIPIPGSVTIAGNTYTANFPLDSNLSTDVYSTSGTIGAISGALPALPEPASMATLGVGLLALTAARRRRKS